MRILGEVFILCCTIAVCARAQGPPPPPPGNQQNPPPSNGTASSPPANDATQYTNQTQNQAPIPSPTEVGPPAIRQLGGAAPLPAGHGPLTFGPIYVESFTAGYVVGDGLSDNPQTGQAVNELQHAALFQGQIVFDKDWGRYHIALQYRPQMVIVNGGAQSDFTNQNVGFGTVVQASPQWSIGIEENYQSAKNNLNAGTFYFHADAGTGAFAQNVFAQAGDRLYANNARIFINYRIDPLNAISIQPFTYYYRLTTPNIVDQTDLDSGFEFDWAHRLTATQTFSLSYGFQDRKFSGTALPDVTYNQFGVRYAQKLRPSIFYNGSLLMSIGSDNLGKAYSAVGNIAVVKTFRNAEVDAAYYRSNDFNGYLNNGYNDRVDGNFGFRVTRNLQAALGGGHFRGATTSNAGIVGAFPSASYALAQANFQLAQHWFCTANYGHRWQNGQALTLPVGGDNFFSFGLRWSATGIARLIN